MKRYSLAAVAAVAAIFAGWVSSQFTRGEPPCVPEFVSDVVYRDWDFGRWRGGSPTVAD